MSSDFPLLDRIPISDRLNTIEKLHKYQQKHYPKTGLDIVRAIKKGTWPPKLPAVTLSDAPSYDYIDEDMRSDAVSLMQQPPHSPEKVK